MISDEQPLDGSVREGMLSADLYAVYEVKHTAEALEQAWGDIFSELQSSGYEMDTKPLFERYAGEIVSSGACEISVPIRKA
ncbi:GyrI-like domain-containing protein [Halalkalibacterium halodurans]|uniref:GyrI-like domain-containing protein n=1 Tax=Halalkalibacterium halodurans TaxID=86665 RepID=UPI0030B86992